MTEKPLATTFIDGFYDSRFQDIAVLINVPGHFEKLPRQKFNLRLEVTLFWRVMKASRKAKTMLLFSSRGYLKPELSTIILLSLIPKRWRPSIVLYGEMFEPESGFAGKIEKLVMKLVNRGVSLYMVYSTRELSLFPQLWGVDPAKMRFCPFYLIPEHTNYTEGETNRSGLLFAGGNSKRDYAPLIKAARQLPEYNFLFATALTLPETPPENVQVDWPKLEEYLKAMKEAEVILLPLRTDLPRTVGLLTMLEALSLGQAVIASNAMGIDDYITNEDNGIVVEGTPESYIKAIRELLAPENKDQLEKIRKNARQSVIEKFYIQRVMDGILPIIQEGLEIKDSWNRKTRPKSGLV